MRTLLLSLLSLFVFAQVLGAREPREDKRIDYLIQSVASIEGGTFIRNGSEHSAAQAGQHLRKKLGKAGERVKTAEEFIEGVAAKSYLSGKAYQIRFANGKTTDAGPYLHEKLRQYDESVLKAK